jgi:predicted flap endonuclease-1-like 5' DNA nuclease
MKFGLNMMENKGFEEYLKRGGRSPSAINRCFRYVTEFESYLQEHRHGKQLAEVDDQDLIEFVDWIENRSNESAKGYLWALRYYYDYLSNDEIRNFAITLREERIDRAPFSLKKFQGVNPDYASQLAECGIQNVNQMLDAGLTNKDREQLSRETRIPKSGILEFVKLSDLARIPGVKGIRARLYYDAGIDTVEKIAAWEPDRLVEKIAEFVAKSGFEGIPTLPAEARYTIDQAKKLPKIVEY